MEYFPYKHLLCSNQKVTFHNTIVDCSNQRFFFIYISRVLLGFCFYVFFVYRAKSYFVKHVVIHLYLVEYRLSFIKNDMENKFKLKISTTPRTTYQRIPKFVTTFRFSDSISTLNDDDFGIYTKGICRF